MPVISHSTSYLVNIYLQTHNQCIHSLHFMHMYFVQWNELLDAITNFTTGGQTCSGISDETSGIQLSYMNDNSKGWIQIAFLSDTLYFTVRRIKMFIASCIDKIDQSHVRMYWYIFFTEF